MASSKQNGEKVAVKFLNPESAEIPAILAQFKQECDVLRLLNHPNICAYKASGEVQKYHYLVMELAVGVSLDRIPLGGSSAFNEEQKILPMETYLKIFRSCFSALGYIHSKGLIHRDIKPMNIILRGENFDNPCLIDFGISKFVSADDDLNLNPDQMFTVAYASPEQLTNKPVDHLSDLFSFGVLMYEKLTGKLPFPGKRSMEVFVAQTKWNFPPPRQLNSKIPKKLEDIILSLLSKDPSERYASAELIISDLDRIIEILRQCREGLSITPIIDDIRGAFVAKKGFKKLTIAEEQSMIKKIRTELLDARQKLRMESLKRDADQDRISSLQELCTMLQKDYERLNEQIQMALGFKSSPLVIDKFNQVFTLNIIAYEKRGVPFSINTIEQKIVNPDGEDISVGKINLSERAKKYFSINKLSSERSSWSGTNWYVGAYEEREFPVNVIVANDADFVAPQGMDCFVWPKEFLRIIQKFGWTGLGVVEKFRGVDRSGVSVYAEHRETILFSQILFDSL